MAEESIVPPREDRDATGPRTIRVFPGGNLPFDMGSLERDAFDRLGDWLVHRSEDGFGYISRMATKKGLVDDEGDPVDVIILFVKLISPKGNRPDRAIIERETRRFQESLRDFARELSRSGKNTVVVSRDPTADLLSDL
jgi:hypothetical protein